MFGFKKTAMPSAKDALPGRDHEIRTASEHFINHHALKGPYPEGSEKAMFGLGCFWGAEKAFWQLDGVYVTAVGYAGGVTPNPTLRRGLLRPHRPQRGGAGVLRPEEDLLRDAAQDLLGEPRPDARHAPGQRRRHAIPLRHLHFLAGAEEGRRGLQGDVRDRSWPRSALAASPPRSSMPRRSISPRTITSSIWPRTRSAIAGWAAPACPARSAPGQSSRRPEAGLSFTSP